MLTLWDMEHVHNSLYALRHKQGSNYIVQIIQLIAALVGGLKRLYEKDFKFTRINFGRASHTTTYTQGFMLQEPNWCFCLFKTHYQEKKKKRHVSSLKWGNHKAQVCCLSSYVHYCYVVMQLWKLYLVMFHMVHFCHLHLNFIICVWDFQVSLNAPASFKENMFKWWIDVAK